MGSYLNISSGITKSHLNRFTILCMNTSISSLANSSPKHIRGPPPNGTYEKGVGPAPSNLEASKVSGFEKSAGSLCDEPVFQCSCQKRSYMTWPTWDKVLSFQHTCTCLTLLPSYICKEAMFFRIFCHQQSVIQYCWASKEWRLVSV